MKSGGDAVWNLYLRIMKKFIPIQLFLKIIHKFNYSVIHPNIKKNFTTKRYILIDFWYKQFYRPIGWENTEAISFMIIVGFFNGLITIFIDLNFNFRIKWHDYYVVFFSSAALFGMFFQFFDRYFWILNFLCLVWIFVNL